MTIQTSYLDITELQAALWAHEHDGFRPYCRVAYAHDRAWQARCWDYLRPHDGTWYGHARHVSPA